MHANEWTRRQNRRKITVNNCFIIDKEQRVNAVSPTSVMLRAALNNPNVPCACMRTTKNVLGTTEAIIYSMYKAHTQIVRVTSREFELRRALRGGSHAWRCSMKLVASGWITGLVITWAVDCLELHTRFFHCTVKLQHVEGADKFCTHRSVAMCVRK